MLSTDPAAFIGIDDVALSNALGKPKQVRKDAPAGQVRLRDASERTENRIDREGWKALGLGLGIAVFVCFVPLLAYIINFLGLIIHETGHTVTAWFFGYPTSQYCVRVAVCQRPLSGRPG